MSTTTRCCSSWPATYFPRRKTWSFSAPSTASVLDAVSLELMRWRWVPEVDFVNGYCDKPLYIEAIAQSLAEYIGTKGLPQKILFSYHGMSKRNLEQGDPYYCFCMKTTRLVAERLKSSRIFWLSCTPSVGSPSVMKIKYVGRSGSVTAAASSKER